MNPNGPRQVFQERSRGAGRIGLTMNLISERGSVTRSSLVCKATCCGSQSRAPFCRRFMVPMHAKDRKEAFHETGNIEPRQKEECRMQNPALPMNLGSEDGPLTPALSTNHWTRRKPGCSADSLSAVSPTGSRQEIVFAASGPIADCQSAIQQTASLRYKGQVQGFSGRILRGMLFPKGGGCPQRLRAWVGGGGVA